MSSTFASFRRLALAGQGALPDRDISMARMYSASPLDYLLPYTQEFWSDSAMETSAARCGVGVDMASLRGRWDALLDATLEEATLRRPAAGGYLSTGKHGVHSEHLGFVLAEMQSLARQHPGAEW